MLAAARSAYAEFGREADTNEIARRAGVGKGTLFRHFATKDALLEAILVERFARLRDQALDDLDRLEPWAALRQMVLCVTADQVADRSFVGALGAWVARLPEALAARDALLDVLEDALQRAQAAGTARTDVSRADLTVVLCGLGQASQAIDDPDDPRWRRFAEIVLDGMQRRDATSLHAS